MTEERTISTIYDWLPAVCSGTEMGAVVQSFDWASTPLGSPSTWSIGLRTAVGVCLTSRFPMLVVWGPDLIKIYNDGYRGILGTEKHPLALGSPARRVWPEIWDEIGPMFAEVMTTGRSTWTEHGRLDIARSGFLEECYFIWSYSPLFDDDGSIGGVLDVVTETTDEVLAQRRLACLSRLSASLVGAEQVTDVCVSAVNALAGSPADVRAVDFHLLVGDRLALAASNRRDDLPPLEHDALLDVLTSDTPVTLGGRTDGGVPADHFVVPVGGALGGVAGVLVISLARMRPFDDGYRQFLQIIAATIGSALDGAYRRSVELGEYRHISDTLQAAMLRPASDLPTVAARYLPAEGNLAVGGDWYDVIDLGPTSRALVVGDCVGHGLDAATVMAQLRSATRAMLLEGRDPASTLDGLDLFATSVAGADCATVVCAVFDRERRVITYSRAGHLPPLVCGAGASVWLDGAAGPPLTLATPGTRTSATHVWNDDDVFITFTDGLIERRGEDLDAGLHRLRAAATELFGSSVHQFADGLLAHLLPERAADDVVLVVKHLGVAATHA